MKPSGHVPNHAGDLSRATGHLRAAVAKRRGRPPAAPFLLQGGLPRRKRPFACVSTPAEYFVQHWKIVTATERAACVKAAQDLYMIGEARGWMAEPAPGSFSKSSRVWPPPPARWTCTNCSSWSRARRTRRGRDPRRRLHFCKD